MPEEKVETVSLDTLIEVVSADIGNVTYMVDLQFLGFLSELKRSTRMKPMSSELLSHLMDWHRSQK